MFSLTHPRAGLAPAVPFRTALFPLLRLGRPRRKPPVCAAVGVEAAPFFHATSFAAARQPFARLSAPQCGRAVGVRRIDCPRFRVIEHILQAQTNPRETQWLHVLLIPHLINLHEIRVQRGLVRIVPLLEAAFQQLLGVKRPIKKALLFFQKEVPVQGAFDCFHQRNRRQLCKARGIAGLSGHRVRRHVKDLSKLRRVCGFVLVELHFHGRIAAFLKFQPLIKNHHVFNVVGIEVPKSRAEHIHLFLR